MIRRQRGTPHRTSGQQLQGCPAPAEWTLYAGGLLAPKRRAVIETHLLVCAGCAEVLVDETAQLRAAEFADAPVPADVWLPSVLTPTKRAARLKSTGAAVGFVDWFRERLNDLASGGGAALAPAYAAASASLQPSVYVVGSGPGAKRRAVEARVVTPPTLERGGRFFMSLRMQGAGRKLAATDALVVVSLSAPRRRKPLIATLRAKLVEGTLRVSGARLEPVVDGVVVAVTVELRKPR